MTDDVNTRFEAAQRVARETYQTAADAARGLYPIVSHSTARRFWANQKITENGAKLRLIWWAETSRTKFLYELLSRELEQVDIGQSVQAIEQLLGDYRYFRYWSEQDAGQLEYVSGTIVIKLNEGGMPVFEHRSHNHDPDPAAPPEHTGFVFLGNGHLYMLGWRASTIRLGMARTLEDRRRSYMHGLVLSVRGGAKKDPFSARFVMVHSDNAAQIQKLQDERVLSPEQYEQFAKRREKRGAPVPDTLTAGEAEFWRCTGDSSYAFFMIA